MAVWRDELDCERKNGRKARAFEAKGSSLYHIHLCLTDIWHTMLTHSWPPLLNERHLSISPCVFVDTCVCEGERVLMEGLSSPQFIGSIWRRTAGVMSALPEAHVCATECDQECVCVTNLCIIHDCHRDAVYRFVIGWCTFQTDQLLKWSHLTSSAC